MVIAIIKGSDIMKEKKSDILIPVGIVILFYMLICPFPSFFGVSGVVWRLIIGLCSCFSIILGIYKKAKGRKKL